MVARPEKWARLHIENLTDTKVRAFTDEVAFRAIKKG
jgi:hypothetical protein